MTPPDSVAEAHERYRGAVERAAARILRDRDAASDVASDAFLAMLEHGPRDRQATLAWLLTTARNRALNVVRDRQRAARRPIERPDLCEQDTAVPDDREASLVATAMARLSERDQAALLLRFVDGASPAEVAGTLGVTAGVARVIVHRAARRLRVETVRVLAGHHHAGEPCVRRLEKLASAGLPAAHDECGPCRAVADEVSALAAHSLVPVAGAPLLHLAAGRLRDLAVAVRPRFHGFEARAAETAAALAIATGLVASTAPAPASAVSVAAAPAARVATARLAAKAPATVEAPGKIAPRMPPANAPLVMDDEGDTSSLVGRPPSVRLLGSTLRFPDALDRSADPGTDIRSFSAFTEAGRDGKPGTLVFGVGLAGRPPASAYYTVSWMFERSGCWATSSLQMPTDTNPKPYSTLSVTCPQSPDGIEWIDPEQQKSSWWVDLVPTFGSQSVQMRIPLRGLEPGLARVLRPGTTLSGLAAASNMMVGAVYSGVDQAPDDARDLRYTIGSD